MNSKLISMHTMRPSFVVGIGASAGGLEALEKLFRAMPVDTGMAFVVIQHLSPDFKSLMNEQLERYTSMRAIPVETRKIIQPNTIYLLPPKKDMVIVGDELICSDRTGEKVLSLPINSFFRSLAAEWGEKAVAVVLSGTGSDGSSGVMDVREGGGLVFAQSEESSRFDGMPRSAVATGCVDAVLSPEEMPDALLAYIKNPQIKTDYQTLLKKAEPDDGIPTIFERLQTVYDIDFNFYKPQTIMRRIERRIALHPEHISIEEYGHRIQNDNAELDLLYKDLLIGVTRFFRDPEAFDVLAKNVIPSILESRVKDDDEARVWVCGCSTGEEAYSIAILFLEAFEALGKPPTLKIIATDLHRESLQFAADGTYPETSFPEMPETLREKYFIAQADNTYKVTANLRKNLIFSEHNLLKDPPFTRIDLVSCRNLLIYLQPTAQLRAIAFFHFALKLKGFLLLGASEGLGELANQFHTEDQHWKIFSKIHEDRLIADLRSPLIYNAPNRLTRNPGVRELRLGRIYDGLLAHFIPAGILVNDQQEAIHIFGDASRYLRPQTGRVSSELFAMAEGSLRIAMMTALRNAEQRKITVSMKGIKFQEGDACKLVDITVEPLLNNPDHTPYYMVLINEQAVNPENETPKDTTLQPVEIDNQADTQIRHLETELQQTRESLQSTVEELETSNEELQAANEELLASNEELQSTNEELHSVNEELYSVNAEHEQKILELNVATSNLNNLIRSTDLATVFLDNDCMIRLFTPRAVEIFPIVHRDIGRDLRHFHSLKPDDSLYDDIACVLADQESIEKQVSWGDNQTMLRRITPYQDVNKKIVGLTLTYIDISEFKNAQQALLASENQFRLLAENTSDWVFMTNKDFQLIYNSPACLDITGYTADEITEIPDFLNKILHQQYQPDYDNHADKHLEHDEHHLDVLLIRRDGSERWVEYNCQSLFNDAGELSGCCGSIRDITERKQHEMELSLFKAIVSYSDNAIISTNVDNIINTWNIGAEKIYGYSANEAIGQPLHVLLDTQQEESDLLRQVCQDGVSKHIELLRTQKNGQKIAVSSTISPILDAKGKIIGLSRISQDITENKRNESELRIAATAFESQEGIVITDADGIIIRVNSAFSDITGYSASEVIGKRPNILKSYRHDADFYAALWKTLGDTGYWGGEIWNKRKNGEIYPQRLMITAVYALDGKVSNYVGTMTDITQSRKAENEIRNLAFYDPLTGLPNRLLLLEGLKQTLPASERSGKTCALLFIDLDNFKLLNDTLGHAVGDMLLQSVAQRLQCNVRDADTVARLSGDEFVIILRDVGESELEAKQQCQSIANKILLAIMQPYQLDMHDHKTSCSIGIALFCGQKISIEELLKQADIAMYEAKSSGRNAACFFNPSMQETITTRANLEQTLQIALEQDQFVLYFQPQITLNNQTVGAEILIRWLHPENGLIFPIDFIPQAEQSNLILSIGEWVLEKACAQLKAWQNNPQTCDLLLAVNVSPRQFHQDDFVDKVGQIIISNDIQPEKLTLELTESIVLGDVNATANKMRALRKLGIRFSLDDFGTGYSSLSHLKRLPINELKIDQSFVQDIATDPDDAAIVQTIIAMAQNLKLNLVAEGVETEEQRYFLEQHGCSVFQGYLFSKPLPLQSFEALLT